MEETLLSLKNNAISLIIHAKNKKELEEVKLQLLGRSGSLTLIMKEITGLPKEQKPVVGKLLNEVKTIIEDTINQKELELKEKKSLNRPTIDVTEPGIKPPLGHLHLVTQAIREITEIFEHIGFARVRYPEVEWDWYAFTSLNFPDNHPARDDWETFFIKQKPDYEKGSVLLTPHTSSGQVREMERQTLPIKMLNIAKCYRRQSDVSHTPMFHQFEGLVVAENISITHLKGTLDYFVKSYFGEERVSRIRPYHFQFTEPSFEVDISCGVCKGTGYVSNSQTPTSPSVISNEVRDLHHATKEQEISPRTGRNDKATCRLCKAGWLEIGGAGMVHPNVLRFGGIDPKKYSGYAFGWGVERVLMMKDGIKIDDLRMLYANDLDFLNQF